MRKILTTSLPNEIVEDIKERAKTKNISVSRYFLHLYEMEKDMISEEDILERKERAHDDYKKGETQILNSLADLV